MSSVTATNTHPAMASPRERLQAELESEISSGTIAESDRSAIETALDAIDETMRSTRPTASAASGKPEDMAQKLADLVDEQVDAGTLTSDQATELKQLFAEAAPQGGPGGPGGAGGPPPPPPEGDASDTGTSTTSSGDIASLLADFLDQLRTRMSSATGYATDGSSTSSSISSLVLDRRV